MGLFGRVMSGFVRAVSAPPPPVAQPPRAMEVRQSAPAVPKSSVQHKGRYCVMRHGRPVTWRDSEQAAVHIAKSQRCSSVVDTTTNKPVWLEVSRPKGQVARIKAERARLIEAKPVDTGEDIVWADLPRVIAQQALSPEAKQRVLPKLLTAEERAKMERRFRHLDPKVLRLSVTVWQCRGMMRLPTGERSTTETVSFWRNDRLCFNLATFLQQQEQEKKAAEERAKDEALREDGRRAAKEARRLKREARARAKQEAEQRAKEEAEQRAKEAAEAAAVKARLAAEAAAHREQEEWAALVAEEERKKAAEEEELRKLLAEEETKQRQKEWRETERVAEAERQDREMKRLIAEEEAAKASVSEAVVDDVMKHIIQVVDFTAGNDLEVTEVSPPVAEAYALPKLDKEGRGKCLGCSKRRKLAEGRCTECRA